MRQNNQSKKYLNPPTELSKIPKPVLEELIKGTELGWADVFFPDGQKKDLNEPYTTSDNLYHWDSFNDFFIYITALTGTTNIKDANTTLYFHISTAPENGEYTAPKENLNATRPTLENLESMQAVAEKAEAKEKELREGIHDEIGKKIERQQLTKDLRDGKKVEFKNQPNKTFESGAPPGIYSPAILSPKQSADITPDSTKTSGADNSIFLGNLPPEELKKKADGDNIVRNIRDAFEREQLIKSLKQETTTPPTPAVETIIQTPTLVADTQQVEEPEYKAIEPSVNEITTSTPPSRRESTEQEVLPDQGEPQVEIPEPEIDKTLIGIPAIPITNEPANDFKQPEISETPIIIPTIEQQVKPSSVEESITPVDNFFANTGGKVVTGPEFLAEVEPVREEKQSENTYNQTAPPPIIVLPPQTKTPTLDEALATIPLAPATYTATVSTVVPDDTSPYQAPIITFSPPVAPEETITETSSDFSAPPTLTPTFVREETLTQDVSPEVTPYTPISPTPLVGSIGIASAVIPEPTETEISSQKEPNQAQIYIDTHIDDVSASPVREEIVTKSPEQIDVPISTPAINQVKDISPTVDNTPTTTYVGPIAVTTPASPEPVVPYSPSKRITPQAEVFNQTHPNVEVDTLPETNKPLEGQLFPGKTVSVTTPEAPPQIYTRVETPSEYTESFTPQPLYTVPTPAISKNKVEVVNVKDSGIRENEIEQYLKGKKIHVASEQEIFFVELSKSDKEKLFELGRSATIDAKTTQQTIELQIENAVKNSPNPDIRNISQETIKNVSTEFVENIKSYGELEKAEDIPNQLPIAQSPVALVSPLINPNDEQMIKIFPDKEIREEVARDAQTISLAADVNKNMSTSLLEPIIDSEPIMQTLYGSYNSTKDNSSYQIAERDEGNEKEENGDIDLRDLHQKAKDIRNLWDRLKVNPKNIAGTGISPYPNYYTITNPQIASGISSDVAGMLGTGAVAGYTYSALTTTWATQNIPLLTGPNIAGYLTGEAGAAASLGFSAATSNALMINHAFNVSSGNFAFGLMTATKGSSSIFLAGGAFGNNSLALMGIKTGGNLTLGLISRGAGTAAATTGAEMVAVGTGAATGTGAGVLIGQMTIPIPIVGAAIGAAITAAAKWIASKIDWTKVQRFFKQNKEVMVIGGVLMLPVLPAVGLLGVLAGGASVLAYGGFGIGSFMLGAWAFLRTIGRFFTAPIKGLLIGFGIMALLVPLILLIINNSAYVMPEGIDLTGLGYGEDGSIAGVGPGGIGSGIGGAIQNPYIGVTKTVSPPGPFQNPTYNHFVTVTYTVTIIAKKETLTNISIKDECVVITKTGQRSCNTGGVGTPNLTISVGIPYTYTYSKTFDMSYIDTLVTNTVTVTATVASQTSPQIASANASIKIGTPPDQCPSIWPTASGYITQGAKTPSGNSHQVLEAIDIGVSNVGVRASHSGTVTASGSDSCYGNYIRIKSTCAGKEFESRYAHLSARGVKVGDAVTMGSQIGVSGGTGTCSTGPHLHYDFLYVPSGIPNYPNAAPYMMSPYIPTNVPRGCTRFATCQVTI